MDPRAASPASRLQRINQFLLQDPGNGELLADACDTALAAGEHGQAQAHVATARRLGLDPVGWTFREARLCIVRRELERGAALLQQLAVAAPQPVLAHDLAYVRFLQQEFAACRDLLQPWLDADLPPQEGAAVQSLWLRASHAAGQVQDAWGWARARRDALPPAVRGIASLLAVDAGDFGAARTWAEVALASHPMQPEALVARATVALAQRQLAAARGWLGQALQANPDDGRTWAMLGLASLQAGDLPLAQAQLERAVALLPGHVGSWHALGWARLGQGERGGAWQAFEQALAQDRNFAESHGALGLLLALQGDGEGARRHLARAERLDRDNVTGRFAQALLRGEAADAAGLRALAAQLLDRPGFFGGSLADWIPRP